MKALFCGLGSIGQRHLRNLKTLLGDSVEIIAWRARNSSPVLNADMTVKTGADLETHYGIKSFGILDDALKEKPDIAFITNPNTLHISTAIKAVEDGCHLFVEKPVSHSLDGVDDLINLVNTKGKIGYVAYQFRSHPAFQIIRDKIDSGMLGQLISAHIVNAEYLPGWHPYEDYRMTHPARKDLGGGCLSIQTHEIDYAQWLFGMPTKIYTMGGHLSNLSVDVEDSVDMIWECGWKGKPLPVHIHLDYLQRPPQRLCEIAGDKGKLMFDYYTNKVEFWDLETKKSEVHQFYSFDRNQMFVNMLTQFLASVDGLEKPLITLEEGRRVCLLPKQLKNRWLPEMWCL